MSPTPESSNTNVGGGEGLRPLSAEPVKTTLVIDDDLVIKALTEAIKRFGVLVPITVDQTGHVLDGRKRKAIATAFDKPIPERVLVCEPEERTDLTTHLNASSSVLADEDWQEQVDYLRSLSFSDRAISKALDVRSDKVRDHKSDDAGDEPKAKERIMALLKQAPDGLTSSELRRDPELAQFEPSTIDRGPGHLRDDGRACNKYTPDGLMVKRGRQAVFYACEALVAPIRKLTPLENKVTKLWDLLGDPQVVEAARAQARGDEANAKAMLRLGRELDAIAREADTARLWQEKQQAEADCVALRKAETERDTIIKGTELKHWEQCIKAVDAATEVLVILWKHFDHMPPPRQYQLRLLDRALELLKVKIHHVEVKMYPNGGRHAVPKGEIIELELITPSHQPSHI